jgi:hypothetical protein
MTDTIEAPPPDRMLLITGHIGVLSIVHEILAVHRNGEWSGADGEIIHDVTAWREMLWS